MTSVEHKNSSISFFSTENKEDRKPKLKSLGFTSLASGKCDYDLEDWQEICRCCDKHLFEENPCASCAVYDFVRGYNYSKIFDNVKMSDLSDGSNGESQHSQKIFSEIVKKPLEGLSKSPTFENSYINLVDDNVKTDNWREIFSGGNGNGQKISRKKIKTSEKSSKAFLTIRGHHEKKHAQRTILAYDYIKKFDEVDCRIVILMDEGYHQAEIARILNKSRQTVNYRIKKILSTGLVKVIQKGKFTHYKPAKDLVMQVHSRINEINQNNKNGGQKVLGRVEGVEGNGSDGRKKLAEVILDVHHVMGVVKIKSSTVPILRMACQNCKKFEEAYKYRKSCRCKRGRFVKMRNWDYFSAYYDGYEISAHNGKEITIGVKGIKLIAKTKDEAIAKAKDVARSVVEKYLDRHYYSETVIPDWDTFEIRGFHVAIENEEINRKIREAFNAQVVKINVGNGYQQFDESPDEEGNSQPHFEYTGKDVNVIDYFSNLVSGKYDEEINRIKEQLAVIAQGGLSSANMVATITEAVAKLEEKLAAYEKILKEIEDIKKAIGNLYKFVKEALEDVIIKASNKQMRELNQALHTIAMLWHRMDKFEEKLKEIGELTESPDK